jgi:hypothetical protein
MECMNDCASLGLLRHANVCLRQFFDRFSGTPVIGGDEELRALLQLHEVLDSVGTLLDGRLQNVANRDVRDALGGYRENLMRLRSELAYLQESAIARRASLDFRREHLHGAKAWSAASRAVT